MNDGAASLLGSLGPLIDTDGSVKSTYQVYESDPLFPALSVVVAE